MSKSLRACRPRPPRGVEAGDRATLQAPRGACSPFIQVRVERLPVLNLLLLEDRRNHRAGLAWQEPGSPIPPDSSAVEVLAIAEGHMASKVSFMLMKRLISSLALVLLATSALAESPTAPAHGVNLNGIMNYDNSCLIFADLIKGAGVFNGFRKVAPKPGYRSDGWPTRVDDSTGSTTTIVGLNAYLPKGNYTLRADGKGKVQFQGNFGGKTWYQVAFNGDGLPRVVNRPIAGVPSGNQITFTVTESDPADPLRNLSFVLPGHVGKTFYQLYLDDLAPFSVLRTMDWQATNGSKLVNWEDRDRNSAKFSYRGRGRIEEETACELANLTKKDLWICIPALASDDFIAQLAKLIDQRLDKERTLYVEYSNEVWNTGMPQYGQLKAARAAAAPAERQAGDWEYIAHRDGHATNLFKRHITSGRKLVRVLARQAAYPATLTKAVQQYKADGNTFDAIACAGYWYTKANIKAATALYKTDRAAAITKIFEGMKTSIAEVERSWKWYQDQANALGVPLLMYEAGQHLAAPNFDASTPLLAAANRHSWMGQAYDKAIASMPRGLGLICWYHDAGTYSKWGFWGLKERTGQDAETAPKYQAVFKAAMPHAPGGTAPRSTQGREARRPPHRQP